MKIEDRRIGPSNPSLIIAEIAQAHDGSLGMAHAYIDALAQTGVDAVKFQTHIAAAESTLDESFRVEFSRQDDTRFAYWQRMEFTFDQWRGLCQHARERGLIFLSSPFSLQAVDLLEKLELAAWKIGSGETVSNEIMQAIMKTGKPVLVSTGMSSFEEIDRLVTGLKHHGSPFALFQCTSKYPVDFTEVGLGVIHELKKRYNCPIGLSDHSGSLYPALAALAQGADMIEAHAVFDKRMFGPDTDASLNVDDFKFLAEARDAFFIMNQNPVDKDKMADSLQGMRTQFGKSLALSMDLPADTILTDKLIVAKKPGTGIPLAKKCELIGKKLVKDVPMNRLLRWDDFEN